MDGLAFLLFQLAHGFILAALFCYGLNFYYLALLAWRHNRPDPPAPPMDELPYVTVQLPLYNEMYVAERLIDSVARLDWDPNRLEIQVLDDSTDQTREIVSSAVERWRSKGTNIRHIHRTQREGFKAGALANGMKSARGEFIAYFDSDFVPPPDFLRRTIPHFADPGIAFLQTRWGHVNRDYSLLTYLQSLAIDAHFMVEQFARSRGGYWFNFNGTAGVWRRAAIEDAGGWTQDTLTEDLDLSYRAFLKGWRAQYLRDVVVPAELPVTFDGYRRQQQRWSKGSFEVAFKHLPRIWSASIPLPVKLESTFHLTGYAIHLLMFGLILDFPFILYLTRQYPDLLLGLYGLLGIAAFAPTVYFAVAQRQLGACWWRRIPAILFMTALGAGMILTTVRGLIHILIRRKTGFERTPKFGIVERQQIWLGKRYQLLLDPIVLVELIVGLWVLGTLLYGIYLGVLVLTIYSGIFFAGILFVTGLTIAQNLSARVYAKKRTFTPNRPAQA